jgi:hypothetical protein
MAAHGPAQRTADVDFTDRALLVRDVLDAQLLTEDGIRLARVADVDLVLDEDGRLRVAALVVGPTALARRVGRRFGALVRRLVGDRFDHAIPVEQLVEVGPWVRLRGRADAYDVGAGDGWLARHLLRFIPGSGAATAGERRKRWKVG